MFIIKIFIEIQKFKLLFAKKSTDKNILVCVNVHIQDQGKTFPCLLNMQLRLTSLPVLVFAEPDLENQGSIQYWPKRAQKILSPPTQSFF